MIEKMERSVREVIRDPGLDKLGIIGGRHVVLSCGHSAIIHGREEVPLTCRCIVCEIDEEIRSRSS